MHIPWGWIKQRPHFIAEHLSKDFSVNVKYRHSNKINQKHLINKIPTLKQDLSISGYRLISFDKIPIMNHFNLEWINKFLFRININKLEKYDYLWITSPLIYQYLPKKKLKAKLVYDCMDDFLEFPDVRNNSKTIGKFYDLEKDLILKADLVISSSQHLIITLKKRYNIQKKIYLINNAMSLVKTNFNDLSKNKFIFETINNLQNPFIYIGTISEWFDFDSIIALLENNKNINILLFGPVGSIHIPDHDRLHVMGPIDHKLIYEIMKYAKALIMPFKINNLILSVNPVKIYEYIYSGKPIIATKYAETEKFVEYIFLYQNADELIQISNNIISGMPKKSSENKMKSFALENSWENRYNDIRKLLL